MSSQPVLNIKSPPNLVFKSSIPSIFSFSDSKFFMSLGFSIAKLFESYGKGYEKSYAKAVEAEANHSPVSMVNPLPEIASVYLLAKAALQNRMTIKGCRINLKMDSVIDYRGGTANVCIETLQVMLFDKRQKDKKSTLHLDQLRVYPALINKLPMQGLQSCYLKHSEKIIKRVRNIFSQHRIKMPEPPRNYDPMNPKQVVGWLEKILLENCISPQYIQTSAKAISAIGDLENSIANRWVNLSLSSYLYQFKNQNIKPKAEFLNVTVSEQIFQSQAEAIAHKQIEALLQEIAQRKQNQSIVLEVRQRVSG